MLHCSYLQILPQVRNLVCRLFEALASQNFLPEIAGPPSLTPSDPALARKAFIFMRSLY